MNPVARHEPLAPGFMVVHGNHPEALRDLMLAWMARHPLGPLEDEWVLVQSNGVAQWLKLSLARDAAEGGVGIAAALRTQLPSRFIWQAYRAVLGAATVPAESPFDKPLLVWRLMRLLPALLAEPVFGPLQRFLVQDDDLRKRHQLAERLADLFDQYQVYRADWLADWARGDDVAVSARGERRPVPEALCWQPRLWRALLEDVARHPGSVPAGRFATTASAAPAETSGVAASGPLDPAQTSRAAVHRRFLAAAQAGGPERPAGLPRRLVVFGISSLPQQSLEVLAALARWVQVLMCVHNPCEHDWSHIVADQDLLRAERHRQRRRAGGEGEISEDALHLHAQPLLAAWGKQGRDFIRLLDAHDDQAGYAPRFAAIGQRIDHFDRNPGDSLLRQLQDDIRDLRPLAETRATWPPLDPARDHSVQFHITHGPQREVEVLHDQLLAALAADATLRPRDILVMVPDVAPYAPHVRAVFGLQGPDDPRHIPFTLADQGQRHQDPLLGALEKLLALPQARVAVSDLLDWLEVPALRQRFGLQEADLPLLHRWIRAAQVRWGLHAEQRAALGLPEGATQNTWDFGLQRMLLGYAAGDGPAWAGIEPMDEIGGLDAALLGPLVQLLQRLEAHWRLLATPAPPAEWGQRLRALLADFFLAEGGTDGFTLLRLENALQAWLDACASAALEEPLPLSVVGEHWLAQLDQPSLNQPFFAGAVTFATLMPMRAIPFRLVALLGMNDGDYPRSRVPMDFDLMAEDWRPGDRSRREDDRYLFLEALLSAREKLHVSWVGRSIHDHTERPPSVLVAQLREHLAAGWRLVGDEALPQAEAGERLLQALTVEHRLQPFHPAYFQQGFDPRLFSHAHEWRAGLQAEAQARAGRDAAGEAGPPDALGPVQAEPLPPSPFAGPLTLRLLADFLKDPVRSFFRLRLGIHFEAEDPASEDHEPFALDALENWHLQDVLIQAQRAALQAGEPREAVLGAELQRMAGRGELPAGAFGTLVQQDLAEPMQRMFDEYAQALALWPEALPDEALDEWPDGAAPRVDPGEREDHSLHLVDLLGALRGNQAGERARVLLLSASLVTHNRYRHDRILPHWVAHLAAHLGGRPLTTRLISKAGSVTLPPLAVDTARHAWAQWLQAWQQGQCRPLPLALQTALAWLLAGGAEAGSGHSEAAARAREKARAAYEDHDPGYGKWAEGRGNPYLARAFPSFEALWAGGEFAHWAVHLVRPLLQAVGTTPPKAGKEEG